MDEEVGHFVPTANPYEFKCTVCDGRIYPGLAHGCLKATDPSDMYFPWSFDHYHDGYARIMDRKYRVVGFVGRIDGGPGDEAIRARVNATAQMICDAVNEKHHKGK